MRKKVKRNESVDKKIEQTSQQQNSPPLSTQDLNFWFDNSELQWFSSDQEQEIDRVLQIAVPQPLKKKDNLIISSNDIREEKIKNQNTKRNSFGFDNEFEPEKNILNVNEFQMQRYENQPQRHGSLNKFQLYLGDISNKNYNQELQERNYLFQDNHCKNNQKQQKQKKTEQFLDASFQFKEEKQSFFDEQNDSQDMILKSVFGYRKNRSSQGKERIYDQQPSPQFYQEKTKQIQFSQELEKPNSNSNCDWKKSSLRKEAKKYQQYKTIEFKDLQSSIKDFYVHEKEGELKINKRQKMDNKRAEFYQIFELTINPATLIGPLQLKAYLKLCVRFKRGYSGQVFCNNDQTETIPLNESDGKVYTKEKQLFLINSSSHIVKLVCCLIKKVRINNKQQQ